MIHLFDHLERELLANGFLYPPDKADTMIRNIRAMLSRAEFTDQEVRTLRGIIVALAEGKHRKRATPPKNPV
jgi:tRNA/rRNA methyltransferase